MCHPLCKNVLKLNEDVNMSELKYAGLFFMYKHFNAVLFRCHVVCRQEH